MLQSLCLDCRPQVLLFNIHSSKVGQTGPCASKKIEAKPNRWQLITATEPTMKIGLVPVLFHSCKQENIWKTKGFKRLHTSNQEKQVFVQILQIKNFCCTSVHLHFIDQEKQLNKSICLQIDQIYTHIYVWGES